MNSFTLNFKVSNLEKDFRDSKQCFFSIILEHQKWIFGMINIISIVGSLVTKDWIVGSLNICTLILIMISIKFKQKYPLIYEVLIITFLLIYNTYLAMEKYLNQIETHYVEGFFISLSCVSALALLSFIERTAMTILIVVLHLIFGIDHNTIFVGSYFKFLMYAIFFLQFTYHFEKLIRIQFIEYKKLQQQLQKITKFNDILSYSIKYDERKSLILIQKNNKTNIQKEDQDEFNKIASSMYLSMKSYKSRITEVINMDQAFSPNRQTLKQLLLNLAVENQNDNPDTPQRNKNEYVLYGFYKQQVFTLCVYLCLDIQPSIIILMKESKSETQEEELKLRMRNNQKQFNYLSKIFDQQIKKSLIYFKWIQNYANKQADIKVINLLLKTINYCLTKGYTDFLNLENFNQIYTIQPKLKQFDIQLLLKDTIAICNGYYHTQRDSLANIIFFEIKNTLSNNFILSDYKYVKLLFLNLLFYTSQASQTIVIELEEIQSKLLQQPIIKVKIIYQHPNKSKQQLQNLPILNPQSLTDLKHNSQVPLELDLAVSVMLIRRLGPFDKLKIIQQKRRSNYLEFYLFKQLTEDFLLMPIISLKPVDKIITQQDSIIMNSFSTELRLDSFQNSVQFL
ncbi:unnamed protein product [Paramecium primaurelia]|uniref:Transmembrane protein n=1 Tax=Paramecium primaurelia TaxID=5886 RepID=A0A8S1NIB1_PARPR|nr:unnamed protein product [Paramecium primaurelia]